MELVDADALRDHAVRNVVVVLVALDAQPVELRLRLALLDAQAVKLRLRLALLDAQPVELRLRLALLDAQPVELLAPPLNLRVHLHPQRLYLTFNAHHMLFQLRLICLLRRVLHRVLRRYLLDGVHPIGKGERHRRGPEEILLVP